MFINRRVSRWQRLQTFDLARHKPWTELCTGRVIDAYPALCAHQFVFPCDAGTSPGSGHRLQSEVEVLCYGHLDVPHRYVVCLLVTFRFPPRYVVCLLVTFRFPPRYVVCLLVTFRFPPRYVVCLLVTFRCPSSIRCLFARYI